MEVIRNQMDGYSIIFVPVRRHCTRLPVLHMVYKLSLAQILFFHQRGAREYGFFLGADCAFFPWIGH